MAGDERSYLGHPLQLEVLWDVDSISAFIWPWELCLGNSLASLPLKSSEMGMTEADSRSRVLGTEGTQSSSVENNVNHTLKGKVVVWKKPFFWVK